MKQKLQKQSTKLHYFRTLTANQYNQETTNGMANFTGFLFNYQIWWAL